MWFLMEDYRVKKRRGTQVSQWPTERTGLILSVLSLLEERSNWVNTLLCTLFSIPRIRMKDQRVNRWKKHRLSIRPVLQLSISTSKREEEDWITFIRFINLFFSCVCFRLPLSFLCISFSCCDLPLYFRSGHFLVFKDCLLLHFPLICLILPLLTCDPVFDSPSSREESRTEVPLKSSLW